MVEKFQNKYRVKSARLKGYDYGDVGSYFVTICTKDKQNFFGQLVEDKVVLSKLGEIANRCWLEIPEHFPNVMLDQFVIMPDHIHGIVIITGNVPSKSEIMSYGDEVMPCRDEAVPRLYKQNDQNEKNDKRISPKPGSLPVVIGSFKSICTREINSKFTRENFAWQTRYYDRIIRNEKEYHNIQGYIINNPVYHKFKTTENYANF